MAAATLWLLNSALSHAFLSPAAGEPSLRPSLELQERPERWSLALPVFSGEVALPPEVGDSPGTGRRSHPGQLKRVTNVTLVLENWDCNFAFFMGPDSAQCPAHGGCQRSFRLGMLCLRSGVSYTSQITREPSTSVTCIILAF